VFFPSGCAVVISTALPVLSNALYVARSVPHSFILLICYELTFVILAKAKVLELSFGYVFSVLYTTLFGVNG
jgi:hypothetical protein